MPRITDWHINSSWTVCGIFATGALWFFASLKDWQNVILTAFGAAIFAILSIYLHILKDSQTAKEVAKKSEDDLRNISRNPTKSNIERVILESAPQEDWVRHEDNIKSTFSYAGDVNLRLEMQYDETGIQCEDFTEPWANNFPDSRATGYWCNVFYGSTQIDRYILVSVDGARALLPTPEFEALGSKRTNVMPINYKIAQIFDTLDTLEQYMRRAGLKVATVVT